MNFIKKIKLILSILLILITLNSKGYGEIVDSILAHVGNRIITTFDVQNLEPSKYKQILEIKDKAERETALEVYTDTALDYLINQNIILISAERERIKVTDQEVDLAINEILSRNNIDLTQLEKELEKENLSLAKYRIQLKNDIINARIRSQVLMPKIIVAEEDIKKFIDSKSEEFDLQDKYKVRILLVKDKKTFNKALGELEDGVKFEDVVKRYSVDPSAFNGGYMGWMEPNLLNNSMKNAILNTKAGTLSKPFKVNDKYGIFLVEEFKDKYNITSEVRQSIVEELSSKNFTNVFNEWLERNKQTIVIIKRGKKFEAR